MDSRRCSTAVPERCRSKKSCPITLREVPSSGTGKAAQRGSFRDGYPADIRGLVGRMSRVKSSCQGLGILQIQACGADFHDHADVHEPRGSSSSLVGKLQAICLWKGEQHRCAFMRSLAKVGEDWRTSMQHSPEFRQR